MAALTSLVNLRPASTARGGKLLNNTFIFHYSSLSFHLAPTIHLSPSTPSHTLPSHTTPFHSINTSRFQTLHCSPFHTFHSSPSHTSHFCPSTTFHFPPSHTFHSTSSNTFRNSTTHNGSKLHKSKRYTSEHVKTNLGGSEKGGGTTPGNERLEEEEEDVFGTLDPSYGEKTIRKFDFEEDDKDCQDYHEEKISDIYRPGREDFLRKLNKLIHEENDLKSAIEVLQVEMKKECVKQEQAHYRVVIHACAKAGYTRKAFELFKDFQDRALKSHIGIYADLFLSCTNCPDKEYGLKKATLLLNRIRENNIRPNRVLFNTIIQAFGRCGDLKTAFALLDEFKSEKYSLNTDSFSFLLQGCISDKENGFRHAVLVWRNLRRKRIAPNIYMYNLMLRAARECGMGNLQYSEDILLACLSRREMERRREQVEARQQEVKLVSLSPGNDSLKSEESWLDVTLPSVSTKQSPQSGPPSSFTGVVSSVPAKSPDAGEDETPNLLAVSPKLDNVLSLSPVDSPLNRLAIMGGRRGLLDLMLEDRIKPDIKTLSILLIIDNSSDAEVEILATISTLEIVPDTAFFNQVIKQRALRGEKKLGMETLRLMEKYRITPDIITFGCLVRCCSSHRESLELIGDMKRFGTRLNVEIMTSFMRSASINLSPQQMKSFLDIVTRERIQPNKRMLDTLETFHQTYRDHLKVKEGGGYVPYPVVLELRQSLRNWKAFTNTYRRWLERVEGDLEEDTWQQYRIPRDDEKRAEKKQRVKTYLTDKVLRE